jgi:hypothetical protein
MLEQFQLSPGRTGWNAIEKIEEKCPRKRRNWPCLNATAPFVDSTVEIAPSLDHSLDWPKESAHSISSGSGYGSRAATLRVHFVAAPVFGFLIAAAHRELAPAFDPVSAAAVTILVMLLDALLVAPFLEHNYGMFRSLIGAWLPFVAVIAAGSAAGTLARGESTVSRSQRNGGNGADGPSRGDACLHGSAVTRRRASRFSRQPSP